MNVEDLQKAFIKMAGIKMACKIEGGFVMFPAVSSHKHPAKAAIPEFRTLIAELEVGIEALVRV